MPTVTPRASVTAAQVETIVREYAQNEHLMYQSLLSDPFTSQFISASDVSYVEVNEHLGGSRIQTKHVPILEREPLAAAVENIAAELMRATTGVADAICDEGKLNYCRLRQVASDASFATEILSKAGVIAGLSTAALGAVGIGPGGFIAWLLFSLVLRALDSHCRCGQRHAPTLSAGFR